MGKQGRHVRLYLRTLFALFVHGIFRRQPALSRRRTAATASSPHRPANPAVCIPRHGYQFIPVRHSSVRYATAVPPKATAPPTSRPAARQPAYIAFLHRHPFATDAYALGFTTGIREDYRHQVDGFRNVDLPVIMLDNEFRDPDSDRYVRRFRAYEPAIAVLGDAGTPRAAREYMQLARDLRAEFPDTIVIIVPKCREAIDIVDEDFVLGYPLGYSSQHAADYSDPIDWRGRHVHLLGGSPPVQYQALQDLTQPTLTGVPPANIVGMDWNGPAKITYLGEYWSRDGWQPADHLSIRATVRTSLREIRAFWQEKGLWPQTTPRDVYGEVVKEPKDPVWAATGGNIYEPQSDVFAPDDAPENDPADPDTDPLEDTIVVDYENGWTLAYRSASERARIEYHDGLTPVDGQSVRHQRGTRSGM